MKPPELCDICGQPVAPEEAYRGEMMTTELMCPTPMAMHKDCFDQAQVMWALEGESECAYDERFPESAAWAANPGDDAVDPTLDATV